jgi:mycothiol synthase
VKVHHDLKPARGEIYAIAIDPDLHGQGYGTQLTLAGLNWMTEQGLKQSILYVESDNRPANRIYSAMGFKRELINRSYQRIVR